MDDNRPDDAAPSPDSSRPKRPPPTIDLEASEVTTKPGEDTGAEHPANGSDASRSSSRSSAALPLFLVAGATGVVTAALVIAAAWALGWPQETTRPIADSNATAIEAISSRLTELEGRASKPTVPDAALSSRFDALEKSITALRGEIAGSRNRSDKFAAELEAIKSAPPVAAAAPASPPDLTEIEGRLTELERTTRADSESIAQAASKPVDDSALRRLVVASMLDLSVRQSEPFTEALSAAKTLVPDPQTLKPLEGFAASGLPSAGSLCRELLTLVPKLEPPSSTDNTANSGLVGRLQAGAAKLVRIERTDGIGSDRSAIVARITAAALRNDVSDAQRELNSLTPTDRAAAQGWLDKARERDAALAASRRFAAEAMAALAKPAP